LTARHALLGAFVAGMVAAGRPALVLLAPLAVPRRPLLGLALLAAALAGSLGAHARIEQLDRTALRLGSSISEQVTLLDLPHDTSFGGWQATVGVRGERVALTAGRWLPRPAVAIGAHLRVAGSLKAAPDWMRSRNVHAALAATSVRPTGTARGGFAGFVDGIRARAERALSDGPVSGLLRGMVLGEGEALPVDVQDDFRAASLTHLVAASGQNVALLAALAVALGTALGLGLRGRLLLALALVVVYVPLAGAGPSIQRAGIMGGAALVAALAGRPSSRAYALLLAAAVTLLANPRAAADPGWQLSFAAVIGIAVGAGRVAGWLRDRRVPRGVADATAMTVAATVATAPLIALHFGRVSPIGLPANVLAAPAVAPVMWLGAIAAAVGQLSASAAVPFTAVASLPAAYLAWLGHAAANMRMVVPVCAVLGCATPAPPELRISFLDVGQGDATLIQAGGRSVLVDAGPPGDHIAARLRGAGVRHLDLLVITHAQADHEGGVPDVLSHVPTKALLDGGRHQARAGQVLHVGPIRLDVLSPPAGRRIPGEDPNTSAIVLEATVDGVRTLLPADAESDVLSALPLEPVDLLKVSHHGSADPGLPALLSTLRPRAAVIEVGAHNRYGHPAASTLHALRGTRVYRTDRDGTVRFELRAGRLVETEGTVP
jgi:competence protein ComEC